jgi:hypothetical protein
MRLPEVRVGQAAVTGAPERVGEDLKGLIGRASVALNRQCHAAHQELEQTQLLLADATRKLLDSFHAANRELSALSESVATESIERNLLSASQHLQFSDLVGQLLATTEQRVDGVRCVSQRLQKLVQAMSVLHTHPEANAVELASEKRAFLEALAVLESYGESRVQQSDMEAGDIDLF